MDQPQENLLEVRDLHFSYNNHEVLKGINLNIKIPGLGGGVKSKVLTTFTRQLATLVDAGLPLLRGMRARPRSF